MSDKKFEEMGIQFKLIEPPMYEETTEFMWKHFFPDEPLTRSLKLERGWFMDKLFLKDAYKDNSSIAAVDKDGKIIGVRFMANVFLALGRSVTRNMKIALKFMDRLNYDVFIAMEDMDCDRMYEGKAVCTNGEVRSKGLGTELIKRSMDLAREKNCTYMYVMASGNYSQRIFQKLDFEVVAEVVYAEFVDSQGEPYLKDVREHIKAQTVIKKL